MYNGFDSGKTYVTNEIDPNQSMDSERNTLYDFYKITITRDDDTAKAIRFDTPLQTTQGNVSSKSLQYNTVTLYIKMKHKLETQFFDYELIDRDYNVIVESTVTLKRPKTE